MNMHWIDWSIIGGLAVAICLIAYNTKKYTRSVADFLSANRCAGKYLLGVADGIAGLGAVSIVAMFEMYYKAGFTALWWQTMLLPVGMLIAISGWVQYRYRQTRAMTMAQFFEIRYSRGFRIFAGLLGFVSGTINFAIFPAVGGRFFQYFCGLPAYPVSLGPVDFDATYAAIMLLLLTISLAFTLMGGQIAVMVTDFVQGTFCNFMFVIIAGYLLYRFSWAQIAEAAQAAPVDASLVNPTNTGETDNFNATYFLIGVFGAFFSFMAWQGNQGYFCAAKSPHEARMGRVIGQLRPITQTLTIVLLPICAFTFLHHADFASGAAAAQGVLATVDSEQLRSQLMVTTAIAQFLPVGIAGAFAAVMFAAFVSTHDTYLHTWGSIFIQDVVLPVRTALLGRIAPLSAKTHIWCLRISILAVAVFIFLFSLLFNQQQDILMYFALTGTIFLGWAGAAIVGGLYWKRGTSAGAWVAAVTGMVLAAAGWYMTYFWVNCQGILGHYTPSFWAWAIEAWPALAKNRCPITAQVLWFYTMVSAALVYVVVSLISGRGRVFDLDRMLHRGKYAGAEDEESLPRRGLRAFAMGKGFSFGDKCVLIGSYTYSLFFFAVFLVGTFYALNYEVADSAWLAFWKVYCAVMMCLTIVIAIWLAIGGTRDLRDLFRMLKTVRRDARDDGTVVGHRNLDELGEGELQSMEVPE